ncbi:MAG: macro domain-containing protein [Nitriliruptoraceae bacterium]
MRTSARFGRTDLELTRGDITAQPDLDAVVNAANAQLTTGGGVAGAIHRAAGPELDRACRPLAPIAPGEVVATDAFGLPNRGVLHALGPVYGRDQPAEVLLADCYRRALELAAAEGLLSVGFPALSTGAFGYPVRPAAEVALTTVKDVLVAGSPLQLVRFVLFSAGDLDVHAEVLAAIVDAESG